MSAALNRRSAIKVVLAGSAALSTHGQNPDIGRSVVDLDTEYQIIDNFGASDCWSMQKIGAWSLKKRNDVADLLFSPDKGAALSCWRFNLGAGVNPQITNSWRTAETFEIAQGQYDWARQRNERWFLEAAKMRGVPQFLAFVNSPPARMTRNGQTFCDNSNATTNLKLGFEDQYARYLADILEHFDRDPNPDKRIAFNYVSPINEPQWGWAGHSQEGMRASNGDIKRILRAVSAELERRRLPVQMAALESGSLPDMWRLNENATKRWAAEYGNYIDSFLNDPSVNGVLSGRIGYHSYGSDRIDGHLVSHRKQLGEKMRRCTSWKLWQTEYCVMTGSDGEGGNGRDLTMKTALEVARIIHLDLTLAGASAWQWWTAVSSADYKDGLIYTDWQKPGDAETIYPARILWVLGHYSRFVRPGMQRVGVSENESDIHGFMASAFKDEIQKRVVIVSINAATHPHKIHFEFALGNRSWRIRKVTPYVTTDNAGDELKAYPDLAPDKPIELPARSVITLDTRFA